jgi:hypothetical protein
VLKGLDDLEVKLANSAENTIKEEEKEALCRKLLSYIKQECVTEDFG